jgi:hypothetical protein
VANCYGIAFICRKIFFLKFWISGISFFLFLKEGRKIWKDYESFLWKIGPLVLVLFKTSCTLRALLRLKFNLHETRYFVLIVFIEENIFFFVFPSGVYPNKSEGFPKREQATYSCPCEKHGFSKFSPHTCSDFPCALLMVIAKASRTGNCKRLNWKGISVGFIGMRGNSTFFSLNFPFKIVASMILFIIFFTGHLVTWSLGHLVT